MATVASASDPEVAVIGSQFLITTGDNLDYLDGKGAIFGHVVEGFDVLEKINDTFCDEKGYPLRDIRIRHTTVLDDPYADPPGLVEPPESPLPSKEQLATVRIGDAEELDEGEDAEAAERRRRENEARAQALTLEIIGDLPFAEVKPPENILFVCKLNPVTDEEALNLIFGRFGKILSCEVIRDRRTGDSLQYAFIEYEIQKDCEMAYFKMQGVLIDDHRIHVDFSQSVSRYFLE
jgi:peptidyl-prolyl cis-trans isomerase-like 4